jgi:hypothetical protein
MAAPRGSSRTRTGSFAGLDETDGAGDVNKRTASLILSNSSNAVPFLRLA